MAQYIPKFAEGDNGEGIQMNTEREIKPVTITLMEDVPEEQENETPKVRLVKRGNYDIDLDRYIADLEYNFEDWINSRDLSNKYKDLVRVAYRNLINEYNSEEAFPGLGNQTLSLRYSNKEKGFDEYQYAQNFFNFILQKQPIYKAPEKKKTPNDSKKNLYDLKTGLYNLFANSYAPDGSDPYDMFNSIYKGNDDGTISQSLIDELISFLDLLYNNLKSGSLKYDNIDEANLANLLNLISDTSYILRSQGLNAEAKKRLMLLGINFNKFLGTPVEVNPILSLLDAYNQSMQLNLIDAFLYYNSIDSLDDTGINNGLLFLNTATKIETNPYYLELLKFADTNPEIGVKWQNIVLPEAAKWVDNEIRANNLKKILDGGNPTLILKDYNVFGKHLYTNNHKLNAQIAIELAAEYWANHNLNNILSDGRTVMLYHDYDNKYIITYDPTERKLIKRSLKSLKNKDRAFFNKLINNKYQFDVEGTLQSYNQRQVLQNKEGGVLKAQFGSIVSYTPQEIHNLFAALEKLRHLEELASLGITEELYQKQKAKEERENSKLFGDDAIEWTAADQARAVSIGADITSMISAFVPGYGTAVSAATGVVGTGANVYADIIDGESLGTVLATLGMGLGLDVMGLIPGLGTAGKTGKIIKSAIKIAPKIWAIGTFLSSDVRDSVAKLINEPNNITVKDWQNIAYATKAVTGLAANAGTGLKRASMRNIMGKPESRIEGKITVKVKEKVKGTDGKETEKVTDKILNIGKEISEELALELLKVAKKSDVKKVNATLQSFGELFKDYTIDSKQYKILKSEKVSKDAIDIQTIRGRYDFSKLQGSIFGDPNARWSDAGLYRSHLYGTGPKSWNPYDWLNDRKNKNKPTTSTASRSTATLTSEKPTTSTKPASTKTASEEPSIILNEGTGLIASESYPVVLVGNNSLKVLSSIVNARRLLPLFNRSSSPIIVEPIIIPQSRLLEYHSPYGVFGMGYTPLLRAVGPKSAKAFSQSSARTRTMGYPGDMTLTRSGLYKTRNTHPQYEWPVSNDYIWIANDKQGGILQKATQIVKNAKGGLIKKYQTPNSSINWWDNLEKVDENSFKLNIYGHDKQGYTFKPIYNSNTKTYSIDTELTGEKLRDYEKSEYYNDFTNSLYSDSLLRKAWQQWYDALFNKDFDLSFFLNGLLRDTWHPGNSSKDLNEIEYINHLKYNSPYGPGHTTAELIRAYYIDNNGQKQYVNVDSMDLDKYNKVLEYGDSEFNKIYRLTGLASDFNNESQKEQKPIENKISLNDLENIEGLDDLENLDDIINSETRPWDDYMNELDLDDEDLENIYNSIVGGGENKEKVKTPSPWHKWTSTFINQTLGGLNLAEVIDSINKNRDTLIAGYRPIYHSPDYKYARVYDPFSVYLEGETQGAENLHRMNQMLTANAESNLAAMSEVISGNRKDKVQRDVYRDLTVAKGIDNNIEAANYNHKSENDEANGNRDRTYAFRLIEAQATADARKSIQDAKSAAIVEARKLINLDISDYNTFYLDTALKQAMLTYQLEASNAYEQFRRDTAGLDYTDEAYKAAEKVYNDSLRNAEIKMYNYINTNTSWLAGWPGYNHYSPYKYKLNTYYS